MATADAKRVDVVLVVLVVLVVAVGADDAAVLDDVGDAEVDGWTCCTARLSVRRSLSRTDAVTPSLHATENGFPVSIASRGMERTTRSTSTGSSTTAAAGEAEPECAVGMALLWVPDVPAPWPGLCDRGGGTDMGRLRKGEEERYGVGPVGGVPGREGGWEE